MICPVAHNLVTQAALCAPWGPDGFHKRIIFAELVFAYHVSAYRVRASARVIALWAWNHSHVMAHHWPSHVARDGRARALGGQYIFFGVAFTVSVTCNDVAVSVQITTVVV